MTGGRRAVPLALALLGACLAASVLIGGSSYQLHVLEIAGIYALAAIGYQLVFGHAGALALSQGAFMGIGAYVSAILDTRWGLGFGAALPFSLGAPLLLAALTAAPVLRLQTHYFALATLIIAQIALLVVTQWEGLTGGANGIGGIGTLPAREGWPSLGFVWGFVALGAGAAWGTLRGRLGGAFAMVRGNAAVAQAIGLDPARLRFGAFVAGALYAGLAGSLYAHVVGVISPDILGFPIMVTCLAIVVIGSPTRVAGAIAGAVLVVELPEWVRALQGAALLAYGAVLLLVVIAVPGGLIGAVERLAQRWIPPRPPPPPNPAVPAAWSDASPNSDPVLVVDNLTRSFGGVRALAGVSFRLRAGEMAGLIGPNGSGKTTLLNAISGLTPAESGRIHLDGTDITRQPSHRIARLGLARSFQSAFLLPEMTACDAVALACHGTLAQGRRTALSLLALLGATPYAHQRAGALATGPRRRVEIARALARHPRLLLLDEPAAGLDQDERTALARCLRDLASAGVALLIIEHDLGFLRPLVERIICLEAGKLIADGTPAAISADQRVLSAYLGGG